MSRDSLFGETILWSGQPKVLTTPPRYRLIAAVSAVVSAVSLCFALVAGMALRADVGGMLLFAAWCATLALGAWRGPLLWAAKIEYLVTDKHVIWRRGRVRRSIDRGAISYAHIRWNPRVPGVGDLVLVRAVPTGALRRTLNLTLTNVIGPDRLWAIVRGLTPGAPLGDGERPLTQRLDDGERVLWSGTPQASPWTIRRAATASLSFFLMLAAYRVVAQSLPVLRRMLRIHAISSANAGILIAGLALTVLLLLAVATGVAYAAIVRPGRLARLTRYLVTDRRVLIRRGDEELHLDRGRITYVIPAPVQSLDGAVRHRAALADVFLVLDGPQARALAPSGAFGGGDGERLMPVLSAIEDAETVSAILRGEAEVGVLPEAA